MAVPKKRTARFGVIHVEKYDWNWKQIASSGNLLLFIQNFRQRIAKLTHLLRTLRKEEPVNALSPLMGG